MAGENCASACPTKDHATFGECVRGVRTVWCREAAGLDASAERRKDRELAEYRRLKREGSQPASTRRGDLERAKRMSDRAGKAYSA